MSTRFTQNGLPMVDSRSLQLLFAARGLYDALSAYVLAHMQALGYVDLSPAILQFLGSLDCGNNYASEIARQLDVSRQMVAKTVKELVLLGYLSQQPGMGKQKVICFTLRGEQLMAEVRQLLATLDHQLDARADINLSQLLKQLSHLQEGLKR